MIAILYLVFVFVIGDRLASRYLHFVSVPHRVAGGFLIGIVVSTWFTYLSAFLLSRTSSPLFWSNILFFLGSIGFLIYWKDIILPSIGNLREIKDALRRIEKWDVVLIAVFAAIAIWIMSGIFIMLAETSSDPASNATILRGFEAGGILPPESELSVSWLANPYFLFLFQSGNLAYLGLGAAASTFILGVLFLTALQICILFFGKSLLGSNQRRHTETNSAYTNEAGQTAVPFYKQRSFLTIASASLLLYALYVFDLAGNPPGFYLDESIVSFNAYQIYLSGQGEFGHSWPLYFPVLRLSPSHDYLGYADPTQIYALAALFFVFPPSVTLSRLLSATAMFLATILLGRLATRISGRLNVGLIVGLTALLTPWLFETGRLAFGTALYPFVLALFLLVLYKVHKKQRWPLVDTSALAATLALLTYTYSIGRLLGPLLALGLVLFATDIERFKNVLKTWFFYAIALLPMLVFHLRNPGALTGRFSMTVGIITPEKSFGAILTEFISNYLSNISLHRLLFIGDTNLRHHITDTAPTLAATVILAVAGIVIVLTSPRKNPWWRYILFGLAASIVPASLTRDPFHMLRLIAFPVFLLTLIIPTLTWLTADAHESKSGGLEPPEISSWSSRLTSKFDPARDWFNGIATTAFRRNLLIGMLILTLVQAVSFQIAFREVGPKRGLWFDDAYQRVFAAAVADPSRPIYLVDGYWGQAYLHGYWYAITQGIDLSNFVHVKQGERPPVGSLVLSSEEKCSNCELVVKDDTYMLYKESEPDIPASPDANVFKGGTGKLLGQFDFPNGVATDSAGNIFVADTGNGRVQKFSKDGAFLAAFGKGICKNPKAVAIKEDKIFVADGTVNRILVFKADNFTLLEQWNEPAEGLYGPADIAIDGDKNLYVADQGRARVVKFGPNGQVLRVWGTVGTGEGEFKQLTGIAFDNERLYVADAGNARVQVFDSDGKFLDEFPVQEWTMPESGWQAPDILYDPRARRLYLSSSLNHQILVFDTNGKKLGKLFPGAPDKLSGPSALAMSETFQLYALNTLSSHVSKIALAAK